MRSLAFMSTKGGVGKTTATINVAARLGMDGHRVLLVDTDPQSNATFVALAGEKPRRPTLLEVLAGEVDAAEAIVPTTLEGVSILPAVPELAEANLALASEVGRERRLRLALGAVAGDFDIAVADTAPTRSLLTTNVLNTVRSLFVPMAPGVFGVLGLVQIQEDVAKVRRFLDNTDVRLAGVFLSMVERTKGARELEAELRALLGDLVMGARVPKSVKLGEANDRSESIFTHAPHSPGALAFEALTEEILHAIGTEGRERGDGPSRGHHAA
jgi:chromosome partitioning protein